MRKKVFYKGFIVSSILALMLTGCAGTPASGTILPALDIGGDGEEQLADKQPADLLDAPDNDAEVARYADALRSGQGACDFEAVAALMSGGSDALPDKQYLALAAVYHALTPDDKARFIEVSYFYTDPGGDKALQLDGRRDYFRLSPVFIRMAELSRQYRGRHTRDEFLDGYDMPHSYFLGQMVLDATCQYELIWPTGKDPVLSVCLWAWEPPEHYNAASLNHDYGFTIGVTDKKGKTVLVAEQYLFEYRSAYGFRSIFYKAFNMATDSTLQRGVTRRQKNEMLENARKGFQLIKIFDGLALGGHVSLKPDGTYHLYYYSVQEHEMYRNLRAYHYVKEIPPGDQIALDEIFWAIEHSQLYELEPLIEFGCWYFDSEGWGFAEYYTDVIEAFSGLDIKDMTYEELVAWESQLPPKSEWQQIVEPDDEEAS